MGGHFIIATLPVGTEGWESSANQRFAERNPAAGLQFDATKAMPQAQWLETLKDLKADTWAWVFEHAARMPTPGETVGSAGEFARIAKGRHKTVVIWLTVQALTRGHEDLMQSICNATRADTDYYVWMDLPGESLQAGEPRWHQTMESLLDKILALTPKEKTVIQSMDNPRSPTRDIVGTKAYINICQTKGINRFCVLSPPQGILDREPWQGFYRTLPKVVH